jgi:hypothetical protein
MRPGRPRSGEIAVHIKRNDQQRLVLVDFPFMAAVMGQLPAILVIWLVVSGNFQMAKNQPANAGWTGLLFFILFAAGWDALLLWFADSSKFDFDLVERKLVWRRRNVYRKKGGVIPFDLIHGVMVDILSSGDGTSYRLALTAEERTIPMMASYTGKGRPSVAKELGQIAAVVNAALKTNPAAEMEDKILELAAAGNYVAAVQMARQRYGDDLNLARRFVDELMQKLPDQDTNPKRKRG